MSFPSCSRRCLGSATAVLLAALLAVSSPAPAQSATTTTPPATTAPAPVRFLVVANRESPLSAVAGGRVARVAAHLGDHVRKGQLLVALDCSDLKAKRAAAEAEYNAAQLRYEAKVKLQGLKSAAALEVELAAAEVNRTKSQIRIFDAELAQCRFVAPFDGAVARVYVKEGQGVAPGAQIVDLVGGGLPKARMNVPSRWLAWLRVGSALDAVVDDTGGHYALTVMRISSRVDAVSQTVEIEAGFIDTASSVLPGMSGRAWPAHADAPTR